MFFLIKLCHILLGHTWIWNRDVEHGGMQILILSLTVTQNTPLLVPPIHTPSSWRQHPRWLGWSLLQMVSLVPHLTRQSRVQWRRIESIAVDWLDRGSPLWKPLVKPMGPMCTIKSFWSNKHRIDEWKSRWLVLTLVCAFVPFSLFLVHHQGFNRHKNREVRTL